MIVPCSHWDGDYPHPTFVTTHTLRGEGFDASEDGTGRGTPLVPVHVPDVAGTLKACKDSGGWSNSADHAAAGYMVPVAQPYTLAIRGRGDSHQLEYRQDGTANALLTPNGGRGGIGVGAIAHAFDARQSDVIQYGDKTGPLDTDGHSVAVAVRTANTSANGHGISAELAHTLDRSQGQAVAIGFDSYNQMLTGDITQTVGTSLELNPKVLVPTLTATNDPSRSPQSSEITAQVAAVVQATAMQVRRLTPEECEALQGFPRSYTAIPWRKKPAAECPDGPRYKALGNSWAVPVVRWIGERINLVESVLQQQEVAA